MDVVRRRQDDSVGRPHADAAAKFGANTLGGSIQRFELLVLVLPNDRRAQTNVRTVVESPSYEYLRWRQDHRIHLHSEMLLIAM